MKTKPVMTMGAVILSYVFLLATPLFARESTDVIVMKNGDHLTGEVKKLEQGVLYVDLEYVSGSIGLDWLQVEQVQSTFEHLQSIFPVRPQQKLRQQVVNCQISCT